MLIEGGCIVRVNAISQNMAARVGEKEKAKKNHPPGAR